ncbi:MAG: molybdopterin molybdotransferase MoeA, partial [Bacillota bacterium]|nr:molybdopterin molybdotransferase MoeA [Bacillota bacterium]
RQDLTTAVKPADIKSEEFIPAFNRSTVDGYAVIAKDTFGASDSNAIIFNFKKEIAMGEMVTDTLEKGCCMYVPTGGMLPGGADSVVMIEYSEKYNEKEIGILKPVAPSENVIYKGEDAKPGEIILKKGRQLRSFDIGTLADLGYTKVKVASKLKVGIISTGDELVDANMKAEIGQVRDVNTDMLAAFVKEENCNAICYGIVKDKEEELEAAIKKAIAECDIVLISGGSSAGYKDKTAKVIESQGELFFHGIAIKPGKPTILGKCLGKPVFGLPGHPVAAYFISKLYVSAAIARLKGNDFSLRTIPAIVTENISANQGRALATAVRLESKDGKLYAHPVRSKSGLIASIAGTDGFILISRNSEGVMQGGIVDVFSILK